MSVRTNLYATVAAVALLPHAPAIAQVDTQQVAEEADLEEIVVEGVRYRGKDTDTLTRAHITLKELPNSISVVTGDSIQDRNALTLEEMVTAVAGVTANTTGALSYSGVALRSVAGASSPVAQTVRENNLAGGVDYPPDAFTIERLEVVKGPAAVTGGSVAPGGYINRIMKRAAEGDSLDLAGSVSSFGQFRLGVDVNQEIGDSVYGRIVIAGQTGGVYQDNADQNHIHILPSVKFEIGDTTTFVVQGNIYVRRGNGFYGITTLDGNVPPVDPDYNLSYDKSDVKQDLDTYGVNAELVHDFLDDLRLTVRGGYDKKKETRDDIYMYNYGNDYVYIEAGVNSLDRDRFAADIFLTKSFELNGNESAITIGADVLDANSSWVFGFADLATIHFDDDPFSNTTVWAFPDDRASIVGNYLDTRGGLTQYGGYLQTVLRPTERLTVTAGARVDSYDNTFERFIEQTQSKGGDTAWSFSGGLSYDVGFDTNVYASYSESFSPRITTANADGDTLPAATAFQYEAGFKSTLNDNLTLTVSAYHIVRDNMAVNDPESRGYQIIGGEITYEGLEVELTGEIVPGFNISLAGSLMDARWTRSNNVHSFKVGDRPSGATNCNIGGVVSYEVQEGTLEGLRFGGSGRHVCKRHLTNGTGISFYDPFTVINGFVSYRFDNGLSMQLHVQNLFDSRFIESGQDLNFIYMGLGRNATLSFSKSF